MSHRPKLLQRTKILIPICLGKDIWTLRAKVNTILCVHKNAFTEIWKNVKKSISSIRILKELLNFQSRGSWPQEDPQKEKKETNCDGKAQPSHIPQTSLRVYTICGGYESDRNSSIFCWTDWWRIAKWLD
jgi:hypothetical protein